MSREGQVGFTEYCWTVTYGRTIGKEFVGVDLLINLQILARGIVV